jgi:hypothetical protein
MHGHGHWQRSAWGGAGSAGPETVQHAWDIMHQDYGVRRREGGRQGTGQRTTKDKEQDGKKLKLV